MWKLIDDELRTISEKHPKELINKKRTILNFNFSKKIFASPQWKSVNIYRKSRICKNFGHNVWHSVTPCLVRYLSDLFYLGILATGSWDASVKVWQCNDMNAYQVNLEHDLLSQLEHENQVRTVCSIVFIKNRSDAVCKSRKYLRR